MKKFTILFLLCITTAFLSNPVWSQTNGRNVNKVTYDGGSFVEGAPGKWLENTANNNRYKFVETHRDDWSVYLIDKSRDISIQLDLYKNKIFIYWDRPQRAFLYTITSATSKAGLTKTQLAKGNKTGLRYGATYTIINGYNNWNGGYLDTCGHSSCGNNLYDVSSSPNIDRDPGTSKWVLVSASGKRNGSLVKHGDKVYLKNQYNRGEGGYLDACGRVSCGGESLFSISTSASKDRANKKTATWTIVAVKGGVVSTNDVVRLRSSYNNWYLQTCGYADCGESGTYDVTLYPKQDRTHKVTQWKFNL